MREQPTSALTVGVLTPHVTPGPELELPALSSGRVATLVSRIPMAAEVDGAVRTPTQLLRDASLSPALDEAAARLPERSVDVLAFASTSAGYAIGYAVEVQLVQRLTDRWGRPAVSSSQAAVDALRANGVQRVAVVHPPWFDLDANDLGRRTSGRRASTPSFVGRTGSRRTLHGSSHER